MSCIKAAAAGCIAAACVACVPLPMHWYVGDGAVGTLEYSTCSPRRDIPIGVMLEHDGVSALVTTMQTYVKQPYVDVRFDVPEGKTLRLEGRVIRADRRDGRPVVEGTIPNVSKVDAPHVSSYNDAPAIRTLMLPVDAPLVGGLVAKTLFVRHYWITAPIDIEGADDVWISLPPVAINGVPSDFPTVHFQRKSIVAVLGFNC